MAPIPEASMISWAHKSGWWFKKELIHIKQHIIHKKSIAYHTIHYFLSSSTIPWYPSYKMLGLKDPAFENRPSRPHWAVMAGGRRFARCQATEERQRAEGKRGAMGETYGAPKTSISRKIWDGFRWFRARDDRVLWVMPWISQVWSFLAFTGEATSVEIDGIPGIEKNQQGC